MSGRDRFGNERKRTIRELRVPSSTICVATIALPSKLQNRVATRPAWIAVSITNPLEPCWMTEPLVRIWNISVRRYRPKNMRSSERPVKVSRVSRGETKTTRETGRRRPPRENTGLFGGMNQASGTYRPLPFSDWRKR